MAQRPSTSVGEWGIIKYRKDPQLVGRSVKARRDDDDDHDRHLRGFLALLTSKNTTVVK